MRKINIYPLKSVTFGPYHQNKKSAEFQQPYKIDAAELMVEKPMNSTETRIKVI